jgi:2-keto-4-pentenoate hydratase
MADVQGISRALLEAETRCLPIAPLTSTYPDLTIEDAYQIQLAGVKARVAAGRKVIGKKVGLTSKAMQDLLGVGEPDYGHLVDDMLVIEGQPCRRDGLLRPKVEGEVAFVMGRRVAGPGVNMADVLRATAGVMPALEIVDSRIRDWKIKLVDTVADNASSARFVLGSRMLPATDFDLRLIGSCLEKNGAVMSSAAGVAVWGHPAASVAWLVNKLAEFGAALEEGDIVLSGAFTAAVDVGPGDVVQAHFDRLGSVAVKFV